MVGDNGSIATDPHRAAASETNTGPNAFRENMTDINGTSISVHPIPVSLKLDFTKIRTESLRDVDGAVEVRLFGLDNCPVLEPTE